VSSIWLDQKKKVGYSLIWSTIPEKEVPYLKLNSEKPSPTYITQNSRHYHRLSRVGFGLFEYLFKKFNTEMVVMSEVGSEKSDSQEIVEEIVSLLHCYSMKLHSSRKNLNIFL
jgi:predicted site-specific integrase-resolvase